MVVETSQQDSTEQTSTSTRVINLRGVEDDLYRQLKALAGLSGLNFREYCLSVFKAHVQQRAEQGGGTISLVMTAKTPAAPAVK